VTPGCDATTLPAATAAKKEDAASSSSGVSSGATFDWLLQRQLEVEMSLRGSLLNSQEGLIKAGLYKLNPENP
jgi:hypothetical protein